MTNQLIAKLCSALQEAFNQPLLKSTDIERVKNLVQLRIPEERLMSWLKEVLSQRSPQGERLSLYQTLNRLEQRAQQWAQQHLTEGYEREQSEGNDHHRELKALEDLIVSIERNGRDYSSLQTAPLFEWLVHKLHQLADGYRGDSSLILSSLLSELDEAFYAEVCRGLPELAYRIQQDTLTMLNRERNRSRPQDFARSLRAVTWAQLRAELQLPTLDLSLYGNW